MPQRTGKKEKPDRPLTGPGAAPGDDRIELRLYVTDRTPRCIVAYDNLVRICGEHAGRPCRIMVIDLLKEPALARRDQITAIPTLVCGTGAGKNRKIVGTLADAEKVAGGLGLAAHDRRHGQAPA